MLESVAGSSFENVEVPTANINLIEEEGIYCSDKAKLLTMYNLQVYLISSAHLVSRVESEPSVITHLGL